MNNKELVKRIREIIREEVRREVNKEVKAIFLKEYKRMKGEGTSTFKDLVAGSVKPKKAPLMESTGDPIKDILNQTQMEMTEGRSNNGTLKFDSNSLASSLGYGEEAPKQEFSGTIKTHNTVVDAASIPQPIVNAITKDYSSFMKKMDDLKNKQNSR